MTAFSDYKDDGHNWITLSTGEFYPDILEDATALYEPVLKTFKRLLLSSESSTRLFRKYVSPSTPVEMLKRKTKAQEICDQFGHRFRPIQEVHSAFMSRPLPDEALCAVLWEYKNRGQSGYDLTDRFFTMFRARYPDLNIEGPQRAGYDIRMDNVWLGLSELHQLLAA